MYEIFFVNVMNRAVSNAGLAKTKICLHILFNKVKMYGMYGGKNRANLLIMQIILTKMFK